MSVRRIAGLVSVMACGLLMTGCGSEGYNFAGPVSGDSPGQMVANLVGLGPPSGPRGEKKDDKSGALTCPDVVVRDGTDSVRIYSGSEASSNVRYQYALGDVARQCAQAGQQISLKVGVEGNVIIGPVGAPGTFTVPVRVVVLRESDKEAAFTKLYTVPVTIPGGQAQAPFRFIADNVVVPRISNKGNLDYTIEVGLDAAGGKPAAAAGVKRRPARARRAAPAPADSAAPAVPAPAAQ